MYLGSLNGCFHPDIAHFGVVGAVAISCDGRWAPRYAHELRVLVCRFGKQILWTRNPVNGVKLGQGLSKESSVCR